MPSERTVSDWLPRSEEDLFDRMKRHSDRANVLLAACHEAFNEERAEAIPDIRRCERLTIQAISALLEWQGSYFDGLVNCLRVIKRLEER